MRSHTYHRPQFARWLFPALAALPFMFGLSAPGCVQNDLSSPLTITEASSGCNSSSPTGPFASGSRVDLNVHDRDGLVADPQVTLEDPGVWTLLAPRSEDVSLTLEALAVGTTTLTVRDSTGAEAQTPLEVAAIASATITLHRHMQPFNLDSALAPGNIAPETLAPFGYGLLPNTSLVLQAELHDTIGRSLGGYGVANWATAPTNALTVNPVEAGNDDIEVRHDGLAVGPVEITCVGGGALTLEKSPAGAAVRVDLLHVEAAKKGTALQLAVDDVATMVAAVYDADGRLLIGDDGDRLNVTLLNDGVLTVVPPPWSEGEDAIELTPELEEQLLDARAFYVRAMSSGTTVISLRVAGISADITITVTTAP